MRTDLCHTSRAALLAATLAASIAAVQAQTNPAPSTPASLPAAPSAATPAESEETIVLTTFEVSSKKDYGYQATNSITATGIGTAIKDTPININVITSEMMVDTGALEMNQLVNRVSSVNTTNRESDKDDKNDLTIRGFPSVVLMNGYEKQFHYPIDFIDRVEVIKGPNAVFYGRVSPGGSVNFLTKRPLFKPQATLSATYGSYDFRKTSIDATGPIGGKVAYRVFASYRDSNEWIDYTEKQDSTLAAALTWKVAPQADLNVNFIHNQSDSGLLHSAPRGHPIYNLPTVNPAVPINTYVPSQLGATAPYATTYIYDLVYGAKGKEGNYSGPDNYSDRDTTNADAAFTWQANDIFTFRHALSGAEYTSARMSLGGFPAADGSVRQNGIRDLTKGKVAQIENEAVITFDFLGANNRLLLGHEYRQLEVKSYVSSIAAVPTFYPRDTVVRLNQYVSQLSGRYGLIEDKTHAFYFSNQSSIIDNRVRFLYGARHTRVASRTGTQAGLTSATNRDKATTFQGGVVVQVVKDILNVYANASESFQPQPNLDADGRRAEPTEGRGLEAGVKADLIQDKLSGSLAFYQVERSKIARRDFARELANNGRNPFFILGGVERSEGLELDFTYTPLRNYQVVFSYGYMWQAETIKDPQTPAQVGRRLFNTPEHVASLWNKYNFTQGPLKGFFIGGGARYSDKHYAHPLFQIGIINDSYVIFDAVAGYATKLMDHDVNLRLTVNNLFDEDYFPGSYIPGEPRRINLSVDMKF